MVYCKLLSVNGNIIKYAVGGFSNDLTGILAVDCSKMEYWIEKQPDNSKIYQIHIDAMLNKQRSNYKQRVFLDKIAYEV